MAEKALTVSQAAEWVKQVLATALPGTVRVVGEVSNFSDRSHWFFSIKDEGATIRCVCFATQAKRMRVKMVDGLQVVVTGRIDYYEAQGNLQIYVEKVEAVGTGGLELKLRALMGELRELGYFAQERKKELPAVPKKVAVVTSRSGAAWQDVIDTARRRWSGCQLYLVDVRVQGGEAAGEVAAAIGALSKQGQSLGIEAIILTRGGGSMEDLWAFNERVVADAIFKCRLPVVAAIGHETDTTVAELVADCRASTPTQAVMRLVPEEKVLRQQVDQWGKRMQMLIKRNLEQARAELAGLARQPLFRYPQGWILPWRKKVEELAGKLKVGPMRVVEAGKRELEDRKKRLEMVMPGRVEREKSRLEGLARQLESVGPGNVLARGYTYTLDGQGKVIRGRSQVSLGQEMTTVFADGRVMSRVTQGGQADQGQKTSEAIEANSGLNRKKIDRGSKKKKDGGQPQAPGLFD